MTKEMFDFDFPLAKIQVLVSSQEEQTVVNTYCLDALGLRIYDWDYDPDYPYRGVIDENTEDPEVCGWRRGNSCEAVKITFLEWYQIIFGTTHNEEEICGLEDLL